MAVTDMEWTEIFKSIKCSRSIADPNPGFKRQLNEFGKSEELKVVGTFINFSVGYCVLPYMQLVECAVPQFD